MTAIWKNRIIGEGELEPTAITQNPRNWRAHPDQQRDTITGVLSDIGWVQKCIVNKRSGVLIDGHMRVALAIQHKQPLVPVVYVDLSNDEEALILATLDPIAALAEADRAQFAALLPDLASDSAAVQQLISTLAAEMDLIPPDETASDEPDALAMPEAPAPPIMITCPCCGETFTPDPSELPQPKKRRRKKSA